MKYTPTHTHIWAIYCYDRNDDAVIHDTKNSINSINNVKELYKLYRKTLPNSLSYWVEMIFYMISKSWWPSDHEFESYHFLYLIKIKQK
jgi:hypothetical protein